MAVVTDNGAGRNSGGGALSPNQVRAIAYQAGFRGSGLDTIVKIATPESGRIPTNHYAPGPQEDSRGLWQINVAPSANPGYASQNLYDPLTNAKAAFAISHGGTNFSPWTTYTSGKYAGAPAGSGQGGGSMPSGPSVSAPNATSVPGAAPSPTVDMAAFQKAQAANIAGNYLRGQGKDPYTVGQPKTGLEGGGNPLLGPGLLTSGAPPKASDFATAQSALQSLAGGTGLNPHPAVMGAAQGGALAGGGKGLQAVVSSANGISANHYNYEWGGGHNPQFAPGHGSGHGSGPGTGYDCSGAISAILHSVGALGSPLTSGGFMSYGQPGPGGPNDVTIYASPTHVFAKIGGKFFGTSGSNPGGGAGWFASADTSGFTVRHVTP